MGILLKRLSILAILGFPISLLGYRFGLFDFSVSFKIIAFTFVLALLVFLLSMIISFVQRKSNPVSAKAARTASMLCLLPMIGLGSQVVAGRSVPEIHNISTDLVNPPQFDKIKQIRSDKHNPLEYDIAKLAPIQKAAYPDIQTLKVNMDKNTAHARATAVAEQLGWMIVDEDPIAGIVEATQSSLLWDFKDDIVIRIREQQQGELLIDLRSVSRIGRSDLGANAKRIRAFTESFLNN